MCVCGAYHNICYEYIIMFRHKQFRGGSTSPPPRHSQRPNCRTHALTCRPTPRSEADGFANPIATERSVGPQHLKEAAVPKHAPKDDGPGECSAIGICTAPPTPPHTSPLPSTMRPSHDSTRARPSPSPSNAEPCVPRGCVRPRAVGQLGPQGDTPSDAHSGTGPVRYELPSPSLSFPRSASAAPLSTGGRRVVCRAGTPLANQMPALHDPPADGDARRVPFKMGKKQANVDQHEARLPAAEHVAGSGHKRHRTAAARRWGPCVRGAVQ